MKPVAYLAVSVAAELGVVAATSMGALLADVSIESVATGGTIAVVLIVADKAISYWIRLRKDRDESKEERARIDQVAEDKQAARDRKTRRDALEEWQQTVADLRTDRELDRKEIHEIRDAFQTEKMARALAEARLDACEKDRAELFRRVEELEKR